MRRIVFAPLAFALACASQNHETVATPSAPPPAAPTKVVEAVPPKSRVDPYLWLEDITGDRALGWVKQQNDVTVQKLASSDAFNAMKKQILEVLDSHERIPGVTRMNRELYNFWRDDVHPRGIWRRTTLEEYRKKEPKWQPLIDVDALGKAEHESWVWKGANCLKPEYRHCLISLSRGGADAIVVREYDLSKDQWVKEGFTLPESKTEVDWVNVNTLFVATDFGPGSMTKSSYPRVVKEWKRGTPLTDAKLVYEGKDTDLSISGSRDNTPGFERSFVERAIDFYSVELFLVGKDGALQKLDIPTDARSDVHREWLLVELRSPWTVAGKEYAPGSLVAAKLDDYLKGKRELTVLFEPTEHTSLASFSWTRHHLLLNTLNDVSSGVTVLSPSKGQGAWAHTTLDAIPPLSSANAVGTDADHTDEYFLSLSGFLTPNTLARGVVDGPKTETLKQLTGFFDAKDMEVEQHFAISEDGTRVPYFVVGAKDRKADGQNPTLLYGYGGFEVSLSPWYSGAMGRAWLARGGVYALANIRGGGEYGPTWHKAALKANRLRAYEDFAAVAKDLFARKVTSREHLAIQGGSNGGLLMGNMLTRYPELFNAVLCQVPLLDMKRYSHLSAGSSWMAEYGDPDKPDEWAFIQKFSPYQNVHEGPAYPPVLFLTSTRDDRVGPVHARKMAAKMLGLGDPVLFYENVEGGHGAAADNKQAAFMDALGYAFLWEHVKAGSASAMKPGSGAAQHPL